MRKQWLSHLKKTGCIDGVCPLASCVVDTGMNYRVAEATVDKFQRTLDSGVALDFIEWWDNGGKVSTLKGAITKELKRREHARTK